MIDEVTFLDGSEHTDHLGIVTKRKMPDSSGTLYANSTLFIMHKLKLLSAAALLSLGLAATVAPTPTWASSHREAPLISNDPSADNTDVYAFRSPDDPSTITIIANYIPFELPEGGPNYFTFNDHVRYEVHIKNKATGNTDDITYRFTFAIANEDPSTFFNIRLGKQNLKTTYTCERSTDGGTSWTAIVSNGVVPPANIGPRSIESQYGLNKPYEQIMKDAIMTASSGEKIFAGPIDDPFFVDLAGIFDLGGFRNPGKDGLAGFNCHTIALKIPIATLQKDHKTVGQATNILDPDFVIGVWASASRPRISTIRTDGTGIDYSSDFVQVSRLGMPLTNEAIIPIGMKDKWNATSPYNSGDLAYADNFTNPELALYVGNGPFSAAVPGLAALRLDTNSLGGGFDFRNGKNGLSGLKGNPALAGTAFEAYGDVLLQPGKPRSVDILPAFYTGVPNAIPYQLATGKTNGPLSAGKPFINNFLPTLGDMLRLNMAVPVTDRNSDEFKKYAKMGLIRAAVLGLTDAKYANTNIEAIPHMDGFPNGRRLEDDVTTIELQAVGGLVLNAVGLWTDDYVQGGSPVTPQLLAKLGFSAGVDTNDVAFQSTFPFVAAPHRGSVGLVHPVSAVRTTTGDGPHMNIAPPQGFFLGSNYPNPVGASGITNLRFHTTVSGNTSVKIFDENGREVATVLDEHHTPGDYSAQWRPTAMANGTYFAVLYMNGEKVNQLKLAVQH